MTARATVTAREAPPMFREAVVDDVPQLQAMFLEFVASTQYARYVGQDGARAAAFLEQLIANPDGVILVAVRDELVIGMLGLLVYAHPMSGERVATEAFWWLDPRQRGWGVWLLRRGERWARGRGARRLSLMAPADNDRVMDVYEALGYEAVEITYQRDL